MQVDDGRSLEETLSCRLFLIERPDRIVDVRTCSVKGGKERHEPCWFLQELENRREKKEGGGRTYLLLLLHYRPAEFFQPSFMPFQTHQYL